MKKSILSTSIAFALSALFLTGCGGGGGGSSAPTKPDEEIKQPVNPVNPPTNPEQPANPEQPIIEKNYSTAVEYTGGDYWRDRGYDGTGIKVAVLDGGVNSSKEFNHLMLVTNQQYGYNSNTNLFSKTNDNNVYSNIHGQHMAEVLAGKNYGYAPGVNLITGVISNSDGYTDLVSIHMGAQWAMSQGAKVINTSFAYGGYVAPDTYRLVYNYESQAQNTFKEAINKNVLLVNSAGNNSENISNIITNPSNEGWVDIVKSKAKEQVIIVGAYDSDMNIAQYSNYAGADKDVQDRFILSPGYGQLDNAEGVFGTSPAAANISGAAAIMMQRWKNLGGKEISKIMLDTADRKFSGYNREKHGMGRVDMVAAFNPIGATTITTTTIDEKVSLSQAGITIPNGFNVYKSATVNVLDSYNRTYGIDAKAFVNQEKSQGFNNMVDALNGREYEYSSNGVEVKSLNGEISSVTKFNSINITANSGNKYTAKSNSLPYLNDKSSFDTISSASRNYVGIDYKNGFYSQAMITGSDTLGYTSGTVLGYESNGFYGNINLASGKLTNSLSGNLTGSEIGFKHNGFLIKGYIEQANYQDTGLFNGLEIQKSGLLLSQELNIGDGKLGFMLKSENGNGSSSLTVVDSVNEDNSLSFSNQKIGFNQQKQELGLTYQNNKITAMGLVGNMDNGIIIGYRNQF